MRHKLFPKAAAAIVVLFSVAAAPLAYAQATNATPASTSSAGKEVLIPQQITRVPEGNDFNHPDSEYSFKHSKSTDNFVLFWAKEYGDDPMANSITNRRFNINEVLKECDRFYNYYVDTLKWVDKDKSFATKYKFLLFVIGGEGGTAFGGRIDNKIGGLLDAGHTHQSRSLRRRRP